MTETPATTTAEEDVNPSIPSQFTKPVQIGELPYVFEGEVPEEPASFELVVGLPEQAWSKIKPEIEEEMTKNQWFAQQYHRLQQALRLGDGRVGSVWVKKAQTQDDAPAIGISRIQTDNRYLPENNEYRDAKGVGSFMLDSLCALADIRGWRIYLEPLERDGRLTGEDLTDWYARRGFEFEGKDTRQMHSNSGSMLRLPRQPDISQPMFEIIGKQSDS